MTREYKVTIIDGYGKTLACRVKDECNFLPVHSGEYITIKDIMYTVAGVRYTIGDIWEQLIYVV